MKSTIKSYNINAHIEDIKCEIVAENGNEIAIISFRNLGYGDITAIKFNAVGYNSFGDIVPVGNRKKFFLIIQDIMIKKNETADNLKVKLPASDIRKLVIEEAQICFADGSVDTYEGKNVREIELREFDYTQQEELSAIHKLYNEKIKYDICEIEGGWICGCGRFNRTKTAICSLCGKEKIKTKNVLSEDGLKRLVEEYHAKLRAEQEEARLKAIADEKAARQKKIKITIGAIIAIIIAIFIGNAIVISGRTTYGSEAEMKAEVAGIYTCYDDDYSIHYQLKIEGDTATKRYYNLGSDHDIELTVRSWNPRKGTFEIAGGIVVVTSTGNLKYDDNLYQQGEYWETYVESASSKRAERRRASLETAFTALEIQDVKVTSNSVYTICSGTIKNTGSKTYSYVEVKGAFKDRNGNVVDTDWTYAVGSEGLAPDEATTFRLSVQKNSDIKSCTVSILDYN